MASRDEIQEYFRLQLQHGDRRTQATLSSKEDGRLVAQLFGDSVEEVLELASALLSIEEAAAVAADQPSAPDGAVIAPQDQPPAPVPEQLVSDDFNRTGEGQQNPAAPQPARKKLKRPKKK